MENGTKSLRGKKKKLMKSTLFFICAFLKLLEDPSCVWFSKLSALKINLPLNPISHKLLEGLLEFS